MTTTKAILTGVVAILLTCVLIFGSTAAISAATILTVAYFIFAE